MLDIGAPELLLIPGVVLIIFGPAKLAGLGSALGQSIRECRRAATGEDEAPRAAP